MEHTATEFVGRAIARALLRVIQLLPADDARVVASVFKVVSIGLAPLLHPFDDSFLSLIALRRLVSFGRALAAGAHILLMCRFVLLCAFARAVARVDLCVNVARLNIASRFAGRGGQHNEIQLRLFHLLVSIYRLFLQRRLPERINGPRVCACAITDLHPTEAMTITRVSQSAIGS